MESILLREFHNVRSLIRRHILLRLPPAVQLQIRFLYYHRRPLRLSRPRTFSEKIQYRKLYERDPRMCAFADKVVAKELVSDILGPEWVIPTLFAGPALPERRLRNWPKPYVIKPNHASGVVEFVRDENPNWKEIEAKCNQWLSSTYGLTS